MARTVEAVTSSVGPAKERVDSLQKASRHLRTAVTRLATRLDGGAAAPRLKRVERRIKDNKDGERVEIEVVEDDDGRRVTKTISPTVRAFANNRLRALVPELKIESLDRLPRRRPQPPKVMIRKGAAPSKVIRSFGGARERDLARRVERLEHQNRELRNELRSLRDAFRRMHESRGHPGPDHDRRHDGRGNRRRRGNRDRSHGARNQDERHVGAARIDKRLASIERLLKAVLMKTSGTAKDAKARAVETKKRALRARKAAGANAKRAAQQRDRDAAAKKAMEKKMRRARKKRRDQEDEATQSVPAGGER